MPKSFFTLGNHPTLSIAEILAVLPDVIDYQLINRQIFIIETERPIKAKALIKKLGGTIKIGLIENELSSPDQKQLLKSLIDLIKINQITGKFNFGISYYGTDKFNTRSLGMALKKHLTCQNIASRYVTSRQSTLSSVVVATNKLLGPAGIEIVLIKCQNKIYLGKTLAVQPFSQLSFRDYGRPARDDYAGMLPPKLAQIMINLAGLDAEMHGNASLLDPFCGSGTILTESLLMGYQNIIGSDNSAQAIASCQKNIAWLAKNFHLEAGNIKLFTTDARQLLSIIKPNSISAIITEPYLGPARGIIEMKKITKELEKLYGQSLAVFKKILKTNGRVVMVWPIFLKSNQLIFLLPNLNNFKIINPLPEQLQASQFLKLTKRKTMIYGRSKQKIWREILILQPNY